MIVYCAECHKPFELDIKGVSKNGLYFCSKECAEKRFPAVVKNEVTVPVEVKKSESIELIEKTETPKPKKKSTKKKISE